MKRHLLFAAALALAFAVSCAKEDTKDPVDPKEEEEQHDPTEYTVLPDPEDVDENSNIPAGELAGSIRVMSFNINNYVGKNDESSLTVWNRRRDPVIRMIKDKKPDVVFYQEIQNTMINYIWQCCKDEYNMVAYQQKADDNYSYKMAFMVRKDRIEVIKNEPRWFSETPTVKYSNSWDCDNIKMAILTRLKVTATGKEFYACGAHFFPDGSVGRRKCSELMASWAYEWAGNDMPAICCGDMNIQPGDALLKPLSDVMEEAVSSAKYSDGAGVMTYNRFGVTPFKFLDHMFFRNMKAITWRVVNSAEDYGIEFMSDHYPVYADFIF